MPENKKHHFVSQFYLRNFGIGKSISVFNIARRQHIPYAPIPGQCQKPYLYGSDNKKEAELAALEGSACTVIRNILAARTPPARGSAAHATLAKFISVQLGRTPAAAAALKLSRDKLYRAIAKDFAERNNMPAEIVDQVKPPPGPDPQLATLAIAERNGELLLDLNMKVLVATDRTFITSDLPVIVYNQWSLRYRASGVRGLTCSGLILLFPLSPEVALMLFDDAIYAASKNDSCIALEPQDVDTLNAAQLLDADANLYYRADPETRTAVDRLPLHWSRPRAERSHMQRARGQKEHSTLVFFYEDQPDVSLKFCFLRQRTRAKKVPVHERGRTFRPDAYAVAKRLDRQEQEHARPEAARDTVWRVVDEV